MLSGSEQWCSECTRTANKRKMARAIVGRTSVLWYIVMTGNDRKSTGCPARSDGKDLIGSEEHALLEDASPKLERCSYLGCRILKLAQE